MHLAEPFWVDVLALLVLFAGYQYFFKVFTWQARIMQVTVPRTRLWVYLVFVSGLLGRILEHLLTWFHWPHSVVEWLYRFFWLFLGVLVVEVVSATMFEYFFAMRRHVDVPAIFRDLARAFMYAAVCIIFFKLVLHVDVTSLVAASGVLAVMLGFALQTVTNDFFAGMSMQVTRPYSPGDWIKIGDKEGKVEHVDWRATAIRTLYDDYVIVPNSKLAHESIYNFSQPTPMHHHFISVGTHYRHAPGRVRAIIEEAVRKVPRIHHDRGVTVLLDGFEDSSVKWKIKFWISEYAHYPHIESDIRQMLWYAFRREGIEIPFPQQVVRLQRETPEDVRGYALNLFERIDWLAALPVADREYLADRIKPQLYARTEVVCRQGEAGRTMYFIRNGHMQIQARHADGTLFLTKDLKAGDFFGEISLLTGEPRTADVVAQEDSMLLMLDKEDFRRIITAGDTASELISRVLGRRDELSREKEGSLSRQAAAEDGPSAATATKSREILNKIRDFFAF